MKKINKYLIMGLMVLLMPCMANAATLNLDNANREDKGGVMRFPLIVTVAEGENITNISVDCDCGGDLDSECKFEQNTTGNVILRDKVFAYLEGTSNKPFPSGDTNIGYLVITNKLASKRSLTFNVTTSQGVESKIKGNTVNISAKEEEREKSHDATLKSLKLSQGTMNPAFNPNIFEYTVYGIADTINSVNVVNLDCTVSNSCNPQVLGNNGSRKINLKQGENKVEIVVNSEAGDDADTKTYVLNIIRGDNGYNSAKLASLSFGDYILTPAFKSDVKEYSLTVPNNVTSVVNVLKFDKQDPNATESLNGFDNFIVGENKATITIDNVNGDETITYTINITRMSDTAIEVLKYKDGEITFRDSDGIQNVLSEEDFKKQYIDEWEKIEDKTYKFDEDGNIIKENDTEDNEEKEEKKKNSTWIIVTIIVVGLIIIGVSGFFIFKKKKPETDTQQGEESEAAETEESKENEDSSNKNSKKKKENNDIDEDGIEEETIKKEKKKLENNTMEIDEALVDLMSTKKYDFKDED